MSIKCLVSEMFKKNNFKALKSPLHARWISSRVRKVNLSMENLRNTSTHFWKFTMYKNTYVYIKYKHCEEYSQVLGCLKRTCFWILGYTTTSTWNKSLKAKNDYFMAINLTAMQLLFALLNNCSKSHSCYWDTCCGCWNDR